MCTRLPREQWHTLILDAHPGYISWQEYEENQRRLKENAQTCGVTHRQCPPREGPALLPGLVVCGRCGGRMTVFYHYRRGRLLPYYRCVGRKDADQVLHGECQSIAGNSIDQAIGDLLVKAVNPLALEVTLAVQQELEARWEETDRLRRAQVDRARYEAELARRRFLRGIPIIVWLPLLWNRTGTKNFARSPKPSNTTSASASTMARSRILTSANRSFRWLPIFLDSGTVRIRPIASASAWFDSSSRMSPYERLSRSKCPCVSEEASTRRSALRAR